MNTAAGSRLESKAASAPRSAPRAARAAVIAGPQQIRLEAVEPPEPGRGQVRIRMEGCGVCASNVPVWEGRSWFNYPQDPGAPGHEGWGTIEAVGPEVEHLQPGQRVAALTYRAYADYDLADASAVLPLPAEFKDQPFPAEPLACAVNVFRRSEIQSGQTVAILGIGFLGAILTRLATNAGARVVAISRRPFALKVAEQFGASQTLSLETPEEIVRRVQQETRGEGCDCVIEATGKQAPLDLATELIRVRGNLVIAGYHQDGLRQINMQQWNWKGIDVINAHERDPAIYLEGMRLALDEVLCGRLDPRPLYTHQWPLEELSHALRATAERPHGFLKALVWMDK